MSRLRCCCAAGAITLLGAPCLAAPADDDARRERLPDYRLKWLGPGREVSVSGDWDSWSRPGVRMQRDEEGSFAADIFLPDECPRINLVMSGVCCYHYKFYVSFAGGFGRWLHDPKQPMDKDPDGWVNNFMCKYARTHDGQLQKSEVATRTIAAVHVLGSPSSQPAGDGPRAASSPKGGRVALEAADGTAPAAAEQPGCLLLPATYFNGSTLRTTSTRVMHGCCEACRRQSGCAAFNWRAEPLPRNCVMLGRDYGIARGTALSSAGTVSLSTMFAAARRTEAARSPLPPPQPPPSHRAHGSGNRHKKRKRSPRKKKKGHAPDVE